MAANLSFGNITRTVRIIQLATSCQNFEESLPYQVQSPVSVDAFRIFVAAFEETFPSITTKNMNDLPLLCEKLALEPPLTNHGVNLSAFGCWRGGAEVG
jgi:hypothetical protein